MSEVQGRCKVVLHVGPLKNPYTILVVPYYHHSIMAPKTLFYVFRPLHYKFACLLKVCWRSLWYACLAVTQRNNAFRIKALGVRWAECSWGVETYRDLG